jgi:CBS domain-containing protein
MNVGEFCNPMVVFAAPDMTVTEAARIMRDQHVGFLPVVEQTEDDKLIVGLLTDRDIVLSVVACDLEPRTMKVGDVMTTDLVTVRSEDDISAVVRAMQQRGVRRVPVVSDRGVLEGIVALDDMLVLAAAQLDVLVRAVNSEQDYEIVERR